MSQENTNINEEGTYSLKKHYQYANGSATEMKYFDFSIYFQTEVDDKIIEESVITLSPQHYKVLIVAMMKALKEYEETFGTIDVPLSGAEENNTEDGQANNSEE